MFTKFNTVNDTIMFPNFTGVYIFCTECVPEYIKSAPKLRNIDTEKKVACLPMKVSNLFSISPLIAFDIYDYHERGIMNLTLAISAFESRLINRLD